VKPLMIHGALLVVAAGLAYSVWDKDAATTDKQPVLSDVWSGSQASFSKLSFEGKTRKVRLESQKDAYGYYYVANVDKEEPAVVDPHAGVQGAPTKAPDDKPTKKESSRFISVKAAETLVKSLAPLKAVRAVGKVEVARNEEFGLDKPEGTLKVTIDGKEHTLVIGGTTPGGSERYARYQNNGEVFAITGDIAQSLMFGDSRLPEHDLHGFKNEDIVKVRLQKGTKTRELLRVKEKNDGWGDTATKQDETAGNWMTKLGRLRGSDFVEKPATALRPEGAIVRVEYFDGGKVVGFVELYKLPSEAAAAAGSSPDKPKASDYLVRTEWDRWYLKVPAATAEQIESDLASVLK
jgi:Domain of unknown function (DUF4340)